MFLFTGTEKGKLVAFQQLVSKGDIVPPVLVFVQTKDRAKELYDELTSKGTKNSLHVDAIHSEKSELQRDRTVRAFRSGQVWVLICTELLGRGIDFKGVNLVVNYDFPPSTVSYIHRIGRTGRAGRRGKAITFFTDQDKVLLRSIAHIVKGSGGQVKLLYSCVKNIFRSGQVSTIFKTIQCWVHYAFLKNQAS